MLTRAKDISIISSSKNQLQEMAAAIYDISKAGPGSATTISFKVDEGFLVLDPENDKIYFMKNITEGVLSPRTRVSEGHIIVASNIEVSSYETFETDDCCFVLENSHIKVKFYKFNQVNRYTNNVIKEFIFKDQNKTLNFGGVEILIDDNETTIVGKIKTQLLNTGSLLPKASLLENVDDSEANGGAGYCYDVKYTLESEADFLLINIENLRRC
ncbi:MAG: hypothetical protein OH319_00015 [Candidatus Parvarchaeota archaeon]|nr:hypothetical protein [Candidatus Jingweiarchaeum tengchongense]MCW1298466.1 hypothetical protein [Candidatus Jingweiarchaeum tengchongense]MCW1304967.1 hypothetical protein [Candidatus Jingweiarchaeum tengchongense]